MGRVGLIGSSILAATWLVPPGGAARADDASLAARVREGAEDVREKVIGW